jgi:hypothetical protein
MRPLSETEVGKYISFRMRAAGYRGPDVFSPRALALITRASGGLTRRINILADKALLSAFSENAHGVTDRQVRAAVADSEFAAVTPRRRPAAWYVGGALAAGLAAGVLLHGAFINPNPSAPEPRPPAPTPPASVPPAAAVGAAAAVPTPAPQPPAPLVDTKSEPTPPPAEALAKAPPAEAPPQPSSKALQRRFASYSPKGHKLLSGRLAAARDWLERSPGEHYALELFWTENTDPARMERFLQRASDLVPLSDVYVVPAPGASRLHVLYGDFATREEALEAGKRLPPRYQQAFRATPRSLAEVRGQI